MGRRLVQYAARVCFVVALALAFDLVWRGAGRRLVGGLGGFTAAALAVGLAVLALVVLAIDRLLQRRSQPPGTDLPPGDDEYLKPIPEDSVDIGEDGAPDLSQLGAPPEHYAALHREATSINNGPARSPEVHRLAYARRVMATWGLIARGAEAVPHATAMLDGGTADEREDGAGIVGAIGRDEAAADSILGRLEGETDTLARDTMISTLGRMRSRKAIPMLARIVRDDSADQDTRWTAADALGDIVRRRFEKQGNAIEAALQWLDEHDL